MTGTVAWLTLAVSQPTGGWIDLCTHADDRRAWRELKGIEVVSAARLDPTDSRRLIGDSGGSAGVLLARAGARDLTTIDKYGDVDVHVEFLIARGSNAGVKLMGLYEIQIFDSFGRAKLTGADMGGIYPRGEDKPTYHTIDDGVPPRVNAARAAGEWQTLDIQFQAPRFSGHQKSANARFVTVELNRQVIHQNVEVKHPTGVAWRLAKEAPLGPLLLQCDHGPVAYRNVRIRTKSP